MENELILSGDRQSQEHDKVAKQIFANKQVVANILRFTTTEFKDYSIPQIVSCIDGEPTIGDKDVDDATPLMDSAGSEAVSVNDGTRRFDIKFKVKTFENRDIELIINIEAQSSYHKNGYALEKRGFYYLSRLISSQYGVEFKNSDFNSLKKVYSIWICMDSPKEYANTITRYNILPENLVGEAPDRPENYDIMSLVIVNLGKTDDNYIGLIKMIDTLFNEIKADRTKSIDILQNEFGIDFRLIGKEVDTMCNLSRGIKEQSFENGKAEGRIEGIAEGANKKAVEMVRRLLAKNFPIEEALELAGIDKKTYDEYNRAFTS